MGGETQKVPRSRALLIRGKRGKLLGNIYLPGGEGPYPVILLLHGIPGIEKLLDFAVGLREAGFAVVQFHYSGCWGSEGVYAVSHCFEDCFTVLDHIEKNEAGDFDLSRVYVLGHSMGGLMAARTAALSPLVKAACIMVPMDFRLAAEEALDGREERYKALIDVVEPWVTDLNWAKFREDAEAHIEEMDLISYAPALALKPVLTVSAARDTLLPKADHIDRLEAAIDQEGRGKHEKLLFDSDHSFNKDRPEVRAAVAGFFRRQAGME